MIRLGMSTCPRCGARVGFANVAPSPIKVVREETGPSTPVRGALRDPLRSFTPKDGPETRAPDSSPGVKGSSGLLWHERVSASFIHATPLCESCQGESGILTHVPAHRSVVPGRTEPIKKIQERIDSDIRK